MSKLYQAVKAQDNVTETTNGMKALKSTLSATVDLFFKIGASRGKDIRSQFWEAFGEDEDLAVRVLQWGRDVRGGAGERALFEQVLKDIAIKKPEVAQRIIRKIPLIGRWKDMLCVLDTPVGAEAVALIKIGLEAGDGLCAKWMPRKGIVAARLTKALGWTPKHYRKTLVALSKTVEQQMCANQWSEIEYQKVPSLASARYQKAFGRHDPVGYSQYISDLEKGVAKINAGAIYPYDVIKSVKRGNAAVADQQWLALPDYLPEGSRLLCMTDTSASMTWFTVGGGDIDGRDVAFSLSMYCAERSKSIFKDILMTFDARPQMVKISGSLQQRWAQISRMPVGGNTDIEAAFKLVLKAAVENEVPANEMPTHIVIFSDMQFDACTRGSNKSALEMMRQKYKESGYEMPKIIFWNLNAHDNVPAKENENGVMLVSGFSPSIMQTVLTGKSVTPTDLMKEAVNVQRYDW